jgi:transcriptional regulator with XRE-family HTH domain
LTLARFSVDYWPAAFLPGKGRALLGLSGSLNKSYVMLQKQIPDLHVGQLIEKVLDERGMTKAEFGRRIKTSRQNVNSILQKKSMDTDYLLHICVVLGTNFFATYSASLNGENPSDESHNLYIPFEKIAPLLRLKPEELAREILKLQEWQYNFFRMLTDDMEVLKRLKV